MAERERSTPSSRREKRAAERAVKAAEEQGHLTFEFMEKRGKAKKRKG